MNSKVRVQINSFYETENAYNVNDKWFPKSLCSIYKNFIIMPEWLAKDKKVKYKFVYNIPKRIEPVYNQEVLDELRY